MTVGCQTSCGFTTSLHRLQVLPQVCTRFNEIVSSPNFVIPYGKVRLDVKYIFNSSALVRIVHQLWKKRKGLQQVHVVGTGTESGRNSPLVAVLLATAAALPAVPLRMTVSGSLQLESRIFSEAALGYLSTSLIDLEVDQLSASTVEDWSVLPALQALTRLAIGDLTLSLDPPEELPTLALPALKELRLCASRSVIAAILPAASAIQALAKLDLGRMSLEFPPGNVPANVLQLTSLRSLRLFDCGIQQLPPLNALRQLTFLDLSWNVILGGLQGAISSLIGLQELRLQKCEHVVAVAPIVRSLPALTYIDFPCAEEHETAPVVESALDLGEVARIIYERRCRVDSSIDFDF